MSITVGHKSHLGRVRTANEDSYCVLIDPQSATRLFVVADGMGGHRAGDVASQQAVAILRDAYSAMSESQGFVGVNGSAQEYLRGAIESVNDRLFALTADQPHLKGMGTTMTAGLLFGTRLVIGHIGDSRAYLIRKETIQQLTSDHSWVAQQVRAGVLTPEEAQQHPRKNVLLRALGGSPRVDVDVYNYDLADGDILVFCSDGLFNLIRDEEIHQVVTDARDPQRACDALVDMANQRGGTDNITVIVAPIDLTSGASPRVTDRSSSRPMATTMELQRVTRAPRRMESSLYWRLLPFTLAVTIVLAVTALFYWGLTSFGVDLLGKLADSIRQLLGWR